MLPKIFFLATSIYIFIFSNTIFANEKLVSLETRKGITQSFLLNKQDESIANVILFAGGHGNLNLSKSNNGVLIDWGKNNFLVRSRDLFAHNNLTVAVIDSASDRKTKFGMLGGFRTSESHVKDIDSVITFLRNLNNKPVWLVGTSRGTESAAFAAIYSKQSPDGVVLTSSMTEENAKGLSLTEIPLHKISIPVLLTSHKEDECWVTPPSGVIELEKRLVKAKPLKIKVFEGGSNPKSGPCNALSPHGFFGIEKEVVKYITDFISIH